MSPKGIDDLLLAGGAPTVLYGDAASAFMATCSNNFVAVDDARIKFDAGETDPADIARGFLATWVNADGVSRLLMWRGEFFLWDDGRYSTISADTLTSMLWAYTDQQCTNITRSFIGNAKMAIASLAMLDDRTPQPAWLSDSAPFSVDEVLATSTALIHLPSLAEGASTFSVPPTPDFWFNEVL